MSSNTPQTPRLNISDLPAFDESAARFEGLDDTSSVLATPGDLDDQDYDFAPQSSFNRPDYMRDNEDLKHLTPAQIHELNQKVLDELIPKERPLVGELAPMSLLREEYENGSESFVKQIDYLVKSGWTSVRRTRGDGDCFYRSLAFAYVQSILHSEDPVLSAASAVSFLEGKTYPLLELAGFQRMVFEDFSEELVSIIRAIAEPQPGRFVDDESLLEAFQTPEFSNSVVVYMRLLASAQIRTDPESFEPFLFHPELGEPMASREFCEAFVEAIGKEADHVQITALSRALDVNIAIAYLDGRPSIEGRVEFVQFSAQDDSKEPLALLYRPGHYDILAKNDAGHK